MAVMVLNIVNLAIWAALLGLGLRWLIRRHRAHTLDNRRNTSKI